MKHFKRLPDLHSRADQKPSADTNLLEFFAILHRVDERTKREHKENEMKKIEKEI